jgi:hypothetical protein
MPFSPEFQEKLRKIEEQQQQEWDAMSEAEKEEIRQISLIHQRKVQSCYQDNTSDKTTH